MQVQQQPDKEEGKPTLPLIDPEDKEKDEPLPEVDETEDEDEDEEITNVERPTGASSNAEPDGGDDDDDDEAPVVTIGDEPSEADAEEEERKAAPGWVKELRKNFKDTQRENRELKQRLERVAAPPREEKVTLGDRPKLDDFDYDSDEYEKKLGEWFERKQKVEGQEAQIAVRQTKDKERWDTVVSRFDKSKSDLGADDYSEYEAVAQGVLSIEQQGLIVEKAKNPALVIYALGRNPKRMQELANALDHGDFIYALAELEGKLKLSKKKAATTPEKKIKGSGSTSGSTDSRLESLRKAAEKTGDYSAVSKYKREQSHSAR